MPKVPKIIFDAALSGNISTRSGRAIIASLEKDGISVVTSERQTVLYQRKQKVFPLTIKADRPLDDLVRIVRSHTPRDVMADFSISTISDGACNSIARICKHQLSGLKNRPA